MISCWATSGAPLPARRVSHDALHRGSYSLKPSVCQGAAIGAAPFFCCSASSTAPLAGRRPAKFGHAYFTATKKPRRHPVSAAISGPAGPCTRGASRGASRDRGRVDSADEAGTTTGPQAAVGPGTNPGARPGRPGRLLVRPGPTHAHSTPRLERCCPSVPEGRSKGNRGKGRAQWMKRRRNKACWRCY